MSQKNRFANNGSETFREDLRHSKSKKKVPNGDTIMYHFNKFSSTEELRLMSEKLFDLTFNFAKKNHSRLGNQKLNVAIDKHKLAYYGKPMDYVTNGKEDKGTTNFFTFLTCAIVVEGKRFTVDCIPVHPLDALEDLVDEIIKKVKSKINVNYVFLDREFDKPKIINVLKKHNVKFIMPKIKNPIVKSWFDKTEDCKSRIIKDFHIGRGEDIATVNLFLVNDKDGVKRAFITNFVVPEQLAHYVFDWYASRWGVEVTYKCFYDLRAKTTSKNYLIRLFYFLFTVCLYNLWILVNICIGICLNGRIPKKPLITADMFALVLYRVYVDSG